LPTRLCHISEIEDPGSKGFELAVADKTTGILVVHKDSQFYAYYNHCPHNGASLDWQQDQFLDLDKTFIMCANHGALFVIETGQCIAGPCVGDCLENLTLTIEKDILYIAGLGSTSL